MSGCNIGLIRSDMFEADTDFTVEEELIVQVVSLSLLFSTLIFRVLFFIANVLLCFAVRSRRCYTSRAPGVLTCEGGTDNSQLAHNPPDPP